METVLWIVGGLVVVIVGLYARTINIVNRRSRDLSRSTGISADKIASEIKSRKITPGEWAVEHNLDPITFERRRLP